MTDSTSFLGGQSGSFSSLYPQVKSLRLKVVQSPAGFGQSQTWEFSEKTICGSVHCMNPACEGGAFDLSWLIAKTAGDLKMHDEGREMCKGAEPIGRSSRTCPFIFRYTIDIDYHESPA